MSQDLFESDRGCKFYLNLKSSDDRFYAVRREHVLEMWQRFKPYADKAFANEFSANPAPRYWEMCVGCSLIDCDLQLSKGRPRRKGDKGLDFKIENFPGRVLWVEATTLGPGDWSDPKVNPDNLVPTIENYDQVLSKVSDDDDAEYVSGQHLRQIQLRVASAFERKIRHLKKRIDDPNDDAKEVDLFIIAIGSGDIQSRIWHDNLIDNLTIASLFAPIRSTCLVDLESGTVPLAEHMIDKIGASDPVTKPFHQIGAELVSGVLFSSRSIVSKSLQWEDDLVWITNYCANRGRLREGAKSYPKRVSAAVRPTSAAGRTIFDDLRPWA